MNIRNFPELLNHLSYKFELEFRSTQLWVYKFKCKEFKPSIKTLIFRNSSVALLPENWSSDCGLRPCAVGESPGFFSAVRTEESAATAAALCDPPPWPLLDGLVETFFGPEDEVNAEFKAAKASLLCLGPSPDALALSCNSNIYIDIKWKTSGKTIIAQNKTKFTDKVGRLPLQHCQFQTTEKSSSGTSYPEPTFGEDNLKLD